MAHRRRSSTRITQRDLQLLAYVAEHGFVLAAHARAFLGAEPYRRLRALGDAGLVRLERNAVGPARYSATRRGLDAVGRSYTARRRRDASYRHEVGAAWLWLAARAGRFGPVGQIISERAMRSHDFSRDRAGDPLGVRTLSFGRAGNPGLHHPDMLLITPQGQRIAVELELSAKGRRKLDDIISGYGLDRRIDAVLYLVENRALGERIRTSARRAGLSDLVHVQLVSLPAQKRDSGRELHRSAERARGIARGSRPDDRGAEL